MKSRITTSRISEAYRTPFASLAMWLLLLHLIASLSSNSVLAQAQKIRLDNNPIATSIEEGIKHVTNQKWVDAIEQFQRVIDTVGDELAPADQHHWLAARWIVHGQLAKLPKEALVLYRKRVDRTAQARLDEGKKKRDFSSLESILRDFFCSRPTEEAINVLAENCFIRGDFDSAERYWRMLAHPASEKEDPQSTELRFPDPQGSIAAIRARLILVHLFRGELVEARTELVAFQKLYPNEEGYLAGESGNYGQLLAEMLQKPDRYRVRRNLNQESVWSSYGGDVRRSGQIQDTLPYYWPDRPLWRVSIPSENPQRREESTPRIIDHPRSLAFHPVIWNDYVFIADAARLFAFRLIDGQPAAIFQGKDQVGSSLDLRAWTPMPKLDLQLPTRMDVRYTLTVSEGHLFVRMGCQPFALTKRDEANPDEPRETQTCIVCLGPVKGVNSWRLTPRWILKPHQENADAPLLFEGTPIVQNDRLYVASLRLQGGESISYLNCYEGIDQNEPPTLLWQREIGKSTLSSSETRHKAELLTLAGSNLVYTSPSGTIISVEAATGKPIWEYRYPKRNKERTREAVYGRDLCPCLFDSYRIFSAPIDADGVFCLDAFSGRLLWQSRSMEVMHLLGVSNQRLICTLDKPMRGITGLNIWNGSERNPEGWLQHDGEGESTFGRGLVSQGIVFWPTKGGMHILSAQDGVPLRQPMMPRDGYFALERFGNLAYGNDCLVVATPLELWGYVAERRFRTARQKDANLDPKNPLKQYRLALAEADAGLLKQAWNRWSNLEISMCDFPFLHEQIHLRLRELCQDFPDLFCCESKNSNTPSIPNPNRLWERLYGKGYFSSSTQVHIQSPVSLTDLEMLPESSGGILNGKQWLVDGCQIRATAQRIEASYKNSNRWSISPDDFQINRLPTTRPIRDLNPAPSTNRFTDYRVVGKRLHCCLNESRWLCISLESGKLIWQHWAGSKPGLLGPNRIRYVPHFYLDQRYLLLQHTTGRIQLIDAQSGTVRVQSDATSLLWEQSPTILESNRIAFPVAPNEVICLDLSTGKSVWNYKASGESSLVGRAPQLRLSGDRVLVGIYRNVGMDFDLLCCDGKKLWTSPTPILGENLELDRMAIDDENWYFISDNALFAYSLTTGERVYRVPMELSEGKHWRLNRTPTNLLLRPDEAIADDFMDSLYREGIHCLTSGIHLGRWFQTAKKSYHSWNNRRCAMYLIDPSNGRLEQKLHFEVPVMYSGSEYLTLTPTPFGSRLQVVPIKKGLLIVAGDKIVRWQSE